MKKCIFFIVVLILFGCRQEMNFHSPLYTGSELKIGVVGKAPDVRETNVSFIPLSLEDILQKKFGQFDGVLIMKEHLKEAAEKPYADIYLQSSVPFVFVDSQKVYLAFVDGDLSYEHAHDMKSGDYLVGFYKDTYVGFGLYNNIKNEKTIQDCYSRLFTVLERIKYTGKVEIR
ncbi:hypothetical protein HNR43_000175 [Anoxybacillus mongoliensis]|uniref:Lipoprotein n=1 Tax=Anoxybacillus mongoliensis TaxID=452565 RepID=A0A7W8JCJ7_9BACL|nr:hypothetical protein [Anoxybacillus mongoliensis]MBB5354220.1 hypothetical protein [Anoxybacillus mongoliensis]